MRFCMDYAWVSRKWIRINKALYAYYQNEESVMHSFDDAFIQNIRIQMESIEDFARNNGILNEIRHEISAVQMRDCLSLCKYYCGISESTERLYRELRKFASDDFYRSRFLLARYTDLNIKYKLFYIMLKYKLIVLIMLMMKIYERGYR